LPWRGVQRKPVGLGHQGHLASLWKFVIAVVQGGYELTATAGSIGNEGIGTPGLDSTLLSGGMRREPP